MIAGIVLAAGLARRMGRSKLLLDWGGRPVIRRAVEQVRAGGVDEVIVVVGPEDAAIRQALSELPVRFVQNPAPETGQGRSIACGVAALGPGVQAVLIALGDQPTLPPEVIPQLLQTYRQTGKPIVAPVYRGVQGNPVLFASSVFAELRELTGDRGARGLLERDAGRLAFVAFDLHMPPDLDTPGEYERLRPPDARV
ncbi:MAG: nucleotidyltransferase family protein [Candidatus Rokubacteria bacterium]|nr:nucleotidyltransferase family protein [Candidatus Rokubacteria bacterium]